ncbi:H-NS histone family protein (plasmid) [Paraburkholderia strydomiana]
MREAVGEFGFTPEDVFDKRRGKGRRAAAPKYRNPETGEMWSGRGRAPRIKDQDLERFRITDLVEPAHMVLTSRVDMRLCACQRQFVWPDASSIKSSYAASPALECARSRCSKEMPVPLTTKSAG